MASASKSTLSDEKLSRLLERRANFVSFVQKHVNSKDDAEDIVQSACMRCVEKLESIREDDSVVAWFYRVLRNAIIDYYRRRASYNRKAEAFARDFKDELAPPQEIREQVCRCVIPVLGSLKPEYRDALTLVDIQDRSLKHLASTIQISGNNAAVRVHRARQALRKQVQITCGACATHGCLNCTCNTSAPALTDI